MRKDIKLKILVALSVVLAAFLMVGYDLWTQPDIVGDGGNSKENVAAGKEKAPDFSFVTLEGMTGEMAGLEEPVILLHFWASWCATCAVEFPVLFELVERNKGRVALLAVSIDDEREAMTRFLGRLEKRQGLKTDISHIYWIWDEKKTISRERFGAVRVPETIFIDRGRSMVTKMAGETDWLGDDVGHTIRYLADEGGI